MKKIIISLTFILKIQLFFAQNLPSYVPKTGLVGWWAFNGNAIDSSGHNNNGVVNNALLSVDRFGKIDNCYSFNGTNSRIEIDDAAILDAQSITISGWFYNASSPQNVTNLAQSLVAKWYYEINCGSAGDAYTVLLINSNNKSRLFGGVMPYNLVNGGIQGDIAVTTNQWHHFIFIHDEKKGGELYLDCKLVGSNNITGPICATTNKLYFGADNRFGEIWRHFSGKIDDIGIWNRVLTPCEIRTLCDSKDVDLSINGPENICQNDTVSFFISGLTDTTSVKWQVDGEDIVNQYSNEVKIPIVANTKSITAIFQYNCQNIKLTKQVTILPASREVEENIQICEGEQYKGYKINGRYKLLSQNVNGCDSITFLNLKVNSLSNETTKDTVICCNSVFSFYDSNIIAPGKYSKIFKNQFGCDSIISIFINWSIPNRYFLGKDSSICNIEKYVLTSQYENTRWNDGTIGKNLTIYDSGIFTGTIFDNIGCITTDSIIINIEGITHFPNIFSPNSDNNNDYFFPTYTNKLHENTLTLKIYDRWGNKVFDTKSTGNLKWDGTLNGKNCDLGNYAYILSNSSCPESNLTGIITLIR